MKISIEELRIGNLVEYNGVICSVYSIESPLPRREERFNEKAVITLSHGGLITATIDEIKPIELTEKWLKDFGFRYIPTEDDDDIYESSNFSLEYYYLSSPEDSGFYFYTEASEEGDVKIESIAHLQNLYYEICRKQLTLKT